jgi:hypothetical protein
MSRTRIRAAVVSIAASAVVCSGALAGCSISKHEEPDKPKAADTQAPTPTPSAETSAEPSASPSAEPSASAAPSPSVTRAATPEGALLTAKELPQLNEASAWTQRRTGPVSSQPFGLCQKFDLLTIGAERAVGRSFTTGGATAGQQVAVFPDAQNTVRAGKVIEAWQRDCATRVTRPSLKVGPISDVSVPHGKGWWYLASYERGDDGHFHSLGVVVSGKRLTLIRMDHDGQDHNYDRGMDPMELAVKTAAAKLG